VASLPLPVSFSNLIVSNCTIMGVISGTARSLIRSSKKHIFKVRTSCKFIRSNSSLYVQIKLSITRS